MFLLFLLPAVALATVSPGLQVVGGGNADIANFAWQVNDLEYYMLLPCHLLLFFLMYQYTHIHVQVIIFSPLPEFISEYVIVLSNG